jgi:hypothetical protein
MVRLHRPVAGRQNDARQQMATPVPNANVSTEPISIKNSCDGGPRFLTIGISITQGLSAL